MRNHVISLYDFTGEALRPWAEAGYQCFAYDIQHKPSPMGKMQPSDVNSFVGGGNIFYIHADLYDPETSLKIIARHNNKVTFMSAFPPGTEAASHIERCSMFGDAFDCPYQIKNDGSQKVQQFENWMEGITSEVV